MDLDLAEDMGLNDNAWLYKTRGNAKVEIGNYDSAIDDFNKAIAIQGKAYCFQRRA